MKDIIIIGAGVAGCYIARELSKFNIDILVLDKENDVGNGTSAANSAIIHAGYDAEHGTLKAKFNKLGNELFDDICSDLDIPFKRIASLVLAFNKEENKIIKELYKNGIKNKINNMQIITGNKARELEKNLSDNVHSALLAKTAAIICPFTLCVALMENALENGVKLHLEKEVKDIIKEEDYFIVKTDKKDYKSKYIINASGVKADKIHDLVGENYFKINPKKGSYYLLDKDAGDYVKRIIFQCPTKEGKGVLVLPTIHGNILVGPDNKLSSRDDKSTNSLSLLNIKDIASKSVKNLPLDKNIRVFSGIRAVSNTRDFIIEESPKAKGFINVAGFDSPGLSSIPAVSKYVVNIVKNIFKRENIEFSKKDNFISKRRKVIRLEEKSLEEKINLISKNKDFGNIICRCENISEAEIIDSINRKAGATNIKAVKKRCRPGAGRCQGSFCMPRVQEIIARELKKDIIDIPYDNSKSYIITGSTKENK